MTDAAHVPESQRPIPMEEAWFERMVAGQEKTGSVFTVCLLADDRPIG